MNWLQHLIVSLGTCHVVLFMFHVPWSGPLLAAAALGGWIPDIDHEKTRIFKFSLAVVFALTFSFAYFAFSVPAGVAPGSSSTGGGSGSSFSPSFFAGAAISLSGGWALWVSLAFALALSLCWFFLKPRHRGIMHHPLAGIGLGAILALVSGNLWACAVAALAFWSHLGADWVWDRFN